MPKILVYSFFVLQEWVTKTVDFASFMSTKLLNISDLQFSYITNVVAGQWLLEVGSSLVPFVNKFSCNTELYKPMTTKFGKV